MTQTEARARLKALTADLPAPTPTRPGYDRPDGRERMKNPRVRLVSRWQDAADRILRRSA